MGECPSSRVGFFKKWKVYDPTKGEKIRIVFVASEIGAVGAVRFHCRLIGKSRKWIEVAVFYARRDQVIAGSLRRGSGEVWRFHFYESFFVQKVADKFYDFVAQDKISREPLAPDVQVAVLKPDFFVNLVAVGIN